jgi:hypothetical protein
MESNYLIQPCHSHDIISQEQQYINNSFGSFNWRAFDISFCEKIVSHYIYDTNKAKFIIIDNLTSLENQNYKSLSETISSNLALNKLASIFDSAEVISCGNNSIWNIFLLHKPSNHVIILCDNKGFFSIGTEFDNIKYLPDSLKNDLLRLLNFIKSK